MPMISYAQNREDVLLARIFTAETGFYIDVGAADPINHSVTKHFYERGWHGVNVEPLPVFYQQLCADRPRDVNLQAAICEVAGVRTLYEVPDSIGCSTLSDAVAGEIRAAGRPITPLAVHGLTLAALCERYVGTTPVDFLKIDVEGAERAALLGMDFQRWRPVVVVVEATEPSSSRTSHEKWEDLLIAAEYAYATFDGLNRYYVRNEDAALAARLAVPPNVFDDYVTLDQARAREQAEAADHRASDAERRATAAEQRATAFEAMTVNHAAATATATAQIEMWRREHAGACDTYAREATARQIADAKVKNLAAQFLAADAAWTAAERRASELLQRLEATEARAEEETATAMNLWNELHHRNESTVPRAAFDAALAVTAATREHVEELRAALLRAA